MDIRLAKLASEYNVGLQHLAEFLVSKGVNVDANPAFKVAVTDDLRHQLDKQYQKDLAAKQAADQMRQVAIEKTKAEKPTPVIVPPKAEPTPPPVVVQAPAPKVEPTPPPVVVEVVQAPPAPKAEPTPPRVVADATVPPVAEKVTKPKADLVAPPAPENKPSEATPRPPRSHEKPAQGSRNKGTDGRDDKPRGENPRKKEKALSSDFISQLRTAVPEPTEKKGLKILGKINLEKDKISPEEKAKRDKERKERERRERTDKERQERQDREKQQREINKKVEETKKIQAEKLQKEAEQAKIDATPKVEEVVIRASDSAKKHQLTGTKIIGRIELPVEPSKETAEQKKKLRKRKKVARSGAPDLEKLTTTLATSGAADGTKPAQQGGGNNRGAQGGGNNRPAGQGGNNANRGGAQGGGGNRPAGQGGNKAGQAKTGTGNNRPIVKIGTHQSQEVSKKDVEDKIRSTMARLGGGGGTGNKAKRNNIRRDKRDKMRDKAEAARELEDNGKLQVTEFVSANELASLMDVNVTDVIMSCMNLGYMVSINQRLDAEIIEIIAEEFGYEVDFQTAEGSEEEEDDVFVDDPADVVLRAPIVTVMGHVDHGKTSLLDFIHKQNVVSGEAGGITQHLGAYEAFVGEGESRRKITFLDTPGHEAFTAMRARGAKVTDVAIIIIAADDGIMPTTSEAISHAQAAGVPMVFAINKIDKENANPERVREQLAQMNLLVEDWGGKYQCQEIAAKKGTGVAELMEKILLEAEMLELKANSKRLATGTSLEASLDKGRGYVTKILVQNGTLRKGDTILAGQHWGKVRNMFDENNKAVKEAGPSTPVLVLGLSGAPQAGDTFKVMTDESEARSIAGKRAQIARNQEIRATKRLSLEEIGRRLALGNFKELKLIIKGDFDGSVEALSDSLLRLSTPQVAVSIIHRAVGAITESDVNLASASDAIIIGFQVRPAGNARGKAEQEGVQIKTYSIIYEVIEEIKAAIEGMLEPTKEEKIVCTAEVRAIYPVKRVGTVIGAFMQDGKITRNTKIRVIRGGIVVFPVKENQVGELGSLKRFKDDVREVAKGFEFGMTIKDFNDIHEGDTIEGYEIIEIKQKL